MGGEKWSGIRKIPIELTYRLGYKRQCMLVYEDPLPLVLAAASEGQWRVKRLVDI